MQIVYRLSPEQTGGKPRPPWFSKVLCFDNCVRVFGSVPDVMFRLICDGTNGEDWREHLRVSQPTLPCTSRNIHCNQGGMAFLEVLNIVPYLQNSSEELVYLVEDDYLHKKGAATILDDGIQLGFDYVTLYDHPDKYLDNGPNDLVREAAEDTRLYLGKHCHWKLTNSTTMTFACRLRTLREDAEDFRKLTRGKVVPPDFAIFDMLRAGEKKRRIGSAVPGFATHCELPWLAPLVDWDEVATGA